jgi:hypothetical protein
MRKTGSTSIQRSLVGLDTAQQVYADLGPANHAGRLQALLSCPEASAPLGGAIARWWRAGFARVGKPELDVAAVRSRFTGSIAKALDRTLIFSGEGVSQRFSEAAIRDLKALLEPHFDQITIAAYVRSPASYATSNFQQVVKSHAGMFAVTAPAYRRLFEKFDTVFGRDRVQLWKFDPQQFPNRCVVQDFARRIGADIPANRIVRENESITREAVSLCYIFNKFPPHRLGRWGGRPLPKIVRGIGSTRFRLSPKLIAGVLERHEADIEWMERRLGEPVWDLEPPSPDDVESEADLIHPGGAIEDELSKLPNWGRPEFRFQSFEQFARLADACRHRLKREF